MILTGNIHTHTIYGDGKDTPERMVQAAEAAGFTTLGFSEHSEAGAARLAEYRAEVRRLAKREAGRLEILCGIEADFDTIPADLSVYDYVIGSSHELYDSVGRRWEVDASPEQLAEGIREGFGGDALAYAQAYYARLLRALPALAPAVIGHFDLLRKYNGSGAFFDENSPAYRRIASDALAKLLEADLVPEVNTGAIARGCRSDPYPADFLLRQILESGRGVVVTSDCHDADRITCAFGETLDRLRRIGFRSVLQLTGKGFTETEI